MMLNNVQYQTITSLDIYNQRCVLNFIFGCNYCQILSEFCFISLVDYGWMDNFGIIDFIFWQQTFQNPSL